MSSRSRAALDSLKDFMNSTKSKMVSRINSNPTSASALARITDPWFLYFFVLLPYIAFTITAPGGLFSVGGPNAVTCKRLIPFYGGDATATGTANGTGTLSGTGTIAPIPAVITAARAQCQQWYTNGGYVSKASIAIHGLAFVVTYITLVNVSRAFMKSAVHRMVPSPFFH